MPIKQEKYLSVVYTFQRSSSARTEIWKPKPEPKHIHKSHSWTFIGYKTNYCHFNLKSVQTQQIVRLEWEQKITNFRFYDRESSEKFNGTGAIFNTENW